MCEFLDYLKTEGRKEGRAEGRADIVRILLNEGKITPEDGARILNLSMQDMKERMV